MLDSAASALRHGRYSTAKKKVTTVNAELNGDSHDKLVAALREALTAMRHARDTWPNYAPDVSWVTAWDQACEALANEPESE